MLNRTLLWVTIACLVLTASPALSQKVRIDTDSIPWKDVLRQKPVWYSSDDAVRIADNVLIYQRDTGGWPKNINMARPLTERERNELIEGKRELDSTIDNSATYTQLAFLARVYSARKLERH